MKTIESFKKGQTVNHKNYGKGKIAEVYLPIGDFKGGVLLDNLTSEGVELLNKHRQIRQMPSGIVIKRCFEDNLNLLS